MYGESTISLSKGNMNPLKWTIAGKSLPEERSLDFPANSSELLVDLYCFFQMGVEGGG